MPRRGRPNIGRHTQVTRRQQTSRQNTERATAGDSTDTNDEVRLSNLFNNNLNNLEYTACTGCRRLDLITKVEGYTCSQCRKNPSKYSEANNMKPCDVPDALKNLTMIEQMLIARVHPVMRVYQFKAYGSQGQYHYQGHVLNVEQDIKSIASSLPTTPDNIGIVVIRRAGVTGYSDFRVRKMTVLRAIQ